MFNKMLRNLSFLVLALMLCGSFAQAQNAPLPSSFRHNENASIITTQPDTSPMFGGASGYGEAYIAEKPGFIACNTAATGTAAVDIIAANAGYTYLVSRVQCTNSNTTASILTLRSGSTVISSDYIGTTTLGNNKTLVQFPKPVLTGLNTAVTVTLTTTGTSTICCANYTRSSLSATPTPTATPTP